MCQKLSQSQGKLEVRDSFLFVFYSSIIDDAVK